MEYRRWRIRGPGRVREGVRAREVEEDWGMSFVRRGLHCCMAAPRADGLLDQGCARRSSGAGWSSSGGGVGLAAGLRQAQALPWPWEMRLAQNGGLRTRVCAGREYRRGGGKSKTGEEEKKPGLPKVHDSSMGTPRAIVGAARAVIVGTEVGCLTTGRAAVVDELGVFLDGHVGYEG